MTDIEGSTRLWEEHPDEMAPALAAHDALLRAAVEDNGGTVIKTTGDGLLARFDDPMAALTAAIDGQRASATDTDGPDGPLRVRMAIHSGSAQEREHDYFGPALNHVARLMAIGHGGQVLVSGVTVTIAGRRLPDDAELIDRGEHRLRDVDQPEHVFQLIAPGLGRDFPPLLSQAVVQTNLPRQLTSFVGRDREMAEVEALLHERRMVTLIGTGGTGKTRLLLETAGTVIDHHSDGVWLVELARVTDPALVEAEANQALGARESPGSRSRETLLDYLRHKQLLLLLDNCEHLIGTVAALVEEILTSCDAVRIAATSREGLGVAGETIYQVPSLAEDTATRLFIERATAANPAFTVDPGSADEEAVTEICRRLDGIPLAIELAAARATVLSPTEILARLGDRFRLLTGGRRTAVPRQQTLQALIDWSWDLLDEADQRRLAGLSVFAGGWTLEAASAIDDDPPDVLDGLERLVERSLVVVDRTTTPTRYRFLESIRQYAADRLAEGGRSDDVRDRHLEWIADLTQRIGADIRGHRVVEWLPVIEDENDNIRAAVEWALEVDPEAAGRITVSMWELWRTRGTTGAEPAAQLFARTAERLWSLPAMEPPDSPEAKERILLVAKVLAAAAFIRSTWTSQDARPWADQSLVLARAIGDEEAIITALTAVTLARIFAGQDEGLTELGAEIMERARRVGDLYVLSQVEANFAGYIVHADPTTATRLFDEALHHARQTGNPAAVAFVTLSKGQVLGRLGELDAAREALEEAYATYSELNDERFALVARSDLGHAYQAAGRYDEAEAIYRETIRAWERTGNRGAIAHQLEAFGFVAIGRGDHQRAATLLGAAEALRKESGTHMIPPEREIYARELERLRSSAAPAVIDPAWAAGRELDTPRAIAFALGGQHA
jgi:predicted ATPase/class 3 adenylate cyclase